MPTTLGFGGPAQKAGGFSGTTGGGTVIPGVPTTPGFDNGVHLLNYLGLGGQGQNPFSNANVGLSSATGQAAGGNPGFLSNAGQAIGNAASTAGKALGSAAGAVGSGLSGAASGVGSLVGGL